MKSEKSGGGQITEKTESQCKVSGGDTVGGLIGKTQYVNSWRDASYTTANWTGQIREEYCLDVFQPQIIIVPT